MIVLASLFIRMARVRIVTLIVAVAVVTFALIISAWARDCGPRARRGSSMRGQGAEWENGLKKSKAKTFQAGAKVSLLKEASLPIFAPG